MKSQSSLENHLRESLRNAESDGARWIDQKLTFDNLHLVATAVDLTVHTDDLWFDRFAIERSKMLEITLAKEYGKPSLTEQTAANEYDKFISQPLNMLSHAGVLRSKKGRTRTYQVADRELLQLVSSSDKGARTFLIKYLEVVLKEFGFWPRFEDYLSSAQTEEDLKVLKEQFGNLLLETTGIGSRGSSKPTTEIGRIFTKVINPICFDRGALGTEGGKVMKSYPSTFDLIYNRPNFRDARKSKKLTRKQFELVNAQLNKDAPNPSELTAIMKKIRKYHEFRSEVLDSAGFKATHVHHIFPRSSFPELSNVPENLLVLTPGQHLQEAHPHGNTSIVDPVFQKTALFLKLESVKKSVEREDGVYSYENFAEVLEKGYGLNIADATFQDCRLAISSHAV